MKELFTSDRFPLVFTAGYYMYRCITVIGHVYHKVKQDFNVHFFL